ncbi:MAG: DUF1848 family protein [candidate division KSB1 bacterium]|nr:DUF1848 family protein [candidate division KSB1 bacterium]
MSEQPNRVISASRRLDMVATQPERLAETLQKKAKPEAVHSVVLWTKNPTNMLQHESLRTCLLEYDQLFLHFTVTGLGGTLLEPGVPSPERVLSFLPALIGFLGDPRRIRIRFDPVIKIQLPDGSFLSNFGYFEQLAPVIAKYGIQDVSTSWVQVYDKVRRRLAQHQLRIIEPCQEERDDQAGKIQDIAEQHGIRMHWCCVNGTPRSRCIDGPLLSQLHPKGAAANCERAGGQRPRCGCTKSWDIGWYYKCDHGCLYCYGQPSV